MLKKLLQILSLACSHKHTTQPFTAAVAVESKSHDWEPVAAGPSHYVVCLDCGRKFAYDWQNMRMIR